MITFLFWNLRGNQEATWPARAPRLLVHLGRLVSSFGVDVLLLAESAFVPSEVVTALTSTGAGSFCFPPSDSERVNLFTRLPSAAVADYWHDLSDGRLTIRRLQPPLATEILLATLHFQDQMRWTSDDQSFQATATGDTIAAREDAVGHQRTLLVGDLNMNPFDPGVVAAQAFNAVMDREIARRQERVVAGRSYRFFYNPMWSCFGDRPGPPGTYFYSGSAPVTHYWHVFDQVLLRPALMDALTELRIMDHDGQESLLTNRGRPRLDVSDHLPILFRLDL